MIEGAAHQLSVGNAAGTAGMENCFDDPALGGSGCVTCLA
jgi:hypothetical protein